MIDKHENVNEQTFNFTANVFKININNDVVNNHNNSIISKYENKHNEWKNFMSNISSCIKNKNEGECNEAELNNTTYSYNYFVSTKLQMLIILETRSYSPIDATGGTTKKYNIM